MTGARGALMGVCMAASACALAEAPLLQVAELPVSMARQAAQAAMEQCRADGYRVSAAVVDRSGLVKALIRDDGAGPHTLDSSRRKAYTAASLRESTSRLARLAAEHTHLQGLRDMNASILLLGGGFPVRVDGQVVGGIGVGGAPGAALDEACARAGLQAIGADPYRDETPETGG